MIEYLYTLKGIDPAVLGPMAKIPRHRFVSDAFRFDAYRDVSIPIGHGQTLSKPSVIARMVTALQPHQALRILEVGTGSGYQSAILAHLVHSIVSMERIPDLSLRASQRLIRMNYKNVSFAAHGDLGRIAETFDAVIIAAGADMLPAGLPRLLKEGGHVVLPLGRGDVHKIEKYVKMDGILHFLEEVSEARFVPFIAESGSGKAHPTR